MLIKRLENKDYLESYSKYRVIMSWELKVSL